MDINRFTEKVQQALSAAQTKAVRYGHQQIDVEHLREEEIDGSRKRESDRDIAQQPAAREAARDQHE